MREVYEASYGKYDSPITAYLYDRMLDGDEGDDYAADGDGEWACRFGRRIMWGDNRGFVYSIRYQHDSEAKAAMYTIRKALDPPMCVMCGDEIMPTTVTIELDGEWLGVDMWADDEGSVLCHDGHVHREAV